MLRRVIAAATERAAALPKRTGARPPVVGPLVTEQSCSWCRVRAMSSTSPPWRRDHLDRTRDAPRREVVADAVIRERVAETPTVMRFELAVKDDAFDFAPGQWVDVTIPGIDVVGGFSLCSPPSALPRLDLAVKRPHRPHAPADWFVDGATVGDSVQLRVGGDCTYRLADEVEVDRSAAARRHLLLVAGGIGVNPVWSVLQEFVRDATKLDLEGGGPTATLLFSAVSEEELIFRDDIERLVADSDGRVQRYYFVTGSRRPSAATSATRRPITAESLRELDGQVIDGWIDDAAVAAALDPTVRGAASHEASAADSVVMLCGPPPMTDAVVDMCTRNGLPHSQILYEKWW